MVRVERVGLFAFIVLVVVVVIVSMAVRLLEVQRAQSCADLMVFLFYGLILW